jgi:hypothetical protein
VQALPERGESEETEQERSGHRVIQIPLGGSPILSGSRVGVNLERTWNALFRVRALSCLKYGSPYSSNFRTRELRSSPVETVS